MNGPQSNPGQPGLHTHPAAHPGIHPQAHPAAHPTAHPTLHPTIRPMPVTPMGPAAPKPMKHDDEPISLVADESNLGEPVKSKIRAFSVAEAHIGPHNWKRTPHACEGGLPDAARSTVD